MKYRQLGTTELDVSEIGFGVWTISTNWRYAIEESVGVKLLQEASDLGVNFFDTADTYGEGYGERILVKALGTHRHEIVLATKFGYDFYTNAALEGYQERSQNFTPEFIRHACEQSLRRLNTDYIDLYQLHNPRIDTIEDDVVFDTLEELVKEGKIRYGGVALGPDVGWFEEGEASMRDRHTTAMQIIYSIIEQEPARRFFPIATEESTGLITRVPHASGLLDGTYTKDMVFDHMSRHSREWLEQGIKKLIRLDFLMENMDASLGQIAIKFALTGSQVASVLPNIMNIDQLKDIAATSDIENLSEESMKRLFELYDEDFYLGLTD